MINEHYHTTIRFQEKPKGLEEWGGGGEERGSGRGDSNSELICVQVFWPQIRTALTRQF